MTYKTPEERAAYARAWRAANSERAREIDAKKRAQQAPGVAYAKTKRWRERNPDKWKASYQKYDLTHKTERLEYQRRHRAENIERYRAYNAKWHRDHRKNQPAKVRAMHLKSLYGLTLDQYDQMLTAQNGHCAICDRLATAEPRGVLHVDHDHETGKVRGLLCARCNTGIGLLNGQFDRAKKYLASS